MRLHQLVAKDAMRRRRRVLYTALGVAIGVSAFVAVLSVSSAGENRLAGELDKYGPNLMVMPAVNDVNLALGDLSLGTLAVGENYIPEEKLPQIREIADGEIREALGIENEGNIATIAPKLYVKTEVKGTSVIVVGFDPEEEMRIKSWWMFSEGRSPENQDEAILGARANAALGVALGDKISLAEQEVTVVGVLEETGADDDYQIFAPLQTVQRAFNKEGLLTSIDIRALCIACPVEIIADAINDTMPGVRAVAVKQIAENEMNMIAKVNRFMLALAGITLAIGSFGVVNTMMSSVYARIRDIGIMKAVGASRRQIVKMFLYEAIAVGLLGGVIGYAIGIALAYVIGPLIYDDLTMGFSLHYLPHALGIAVLVAAVASVYPAFRASRIGVSDSIRAL